METFSIKDPQSRIFEYKKVSHDRYKYKVTADYLVKTCVLPLAPINHVFFGLERGGLLHIKAGYMWDGASGPTIDTKNIPRASCVHDVFYQMMRERYIKSGHKDSADQELRRIMMEDWVPKTPLGHLWNKIRGNYFYYGVKWFGAKHCKPV